MRTRTLFLSLGGLVFLLSAAIIMTTPSQLPPRVGVDITVRPDQGSFIVEKDKKISKVGLANDPDRHLVTLDRAYVLADDGAGVVKQGSPRYQDVAREYELQILPDF